MIEYDTRPAHQAMREIDTSTSLGALVAERPTRAQLFERLRILFPRVREMSAG